MTVSGISSVSSSLTAVQGSFKDRQADFQALGSALQSGDVAGAQKAFAGLQQEIQKAHGHHHHHHHHKASSATDPTASSNTTDSTDATGSLGSIINVQG